METGRKEIINLWNEAFGDSPDEINEFLDIFGDCILTERADGKIVSQLFLIPGSLNSRKAYYLYAAATLEKYRGRGLMTELLSEAGEYAMRNGADYILLMPGEESLYGFYERFGYKPFCFVNDCILEADNIPDIIVRKENLYTHNERIYNYAESAYSFSLKIFRSESGTLIYKTESGTAEVKEWHSENIASLLKEFTAFSNVKKIKINLPADSVCTGSGKIKKHGMILPLGNARCEGMYYLDYVLD